VNHAFASDKTLKEGCEACLWPHADGKGLHLMLDVVPLDSRVTMRVPSENDEVPIGQHNLFSYRFSDTYCISRRNLRGGMHLWVR
jgi:hypothetical protein